MKQKVSFFFLTPNKIESHYVVSINVVLVNLLVVFPQAAHFWLFSNIVQDQNKLLCCIIQDKYM